MSLLYLLFFIIIIIIVFLLIDVIILTFRNKWGGSMEGAGHDASPIDEEDAKLFDWFASLPQINWGDDPPKFKSVIGCSVLYEDMNTLYKIYPLCCKQCRIRAETWVNKHLDAQKKHPDLVFTWSPRYSKTRPDDNTTFYYPFVILTTPKPIYIPDIQKGVLHVEELQKLYNFAKIGAYDTSLDNVGMQLDASGELTTLKLIHLDHEKCQKTAILGCLNPELIAENDRDEYEKIKDSFER